VTAIGAAIEFKSAQIGRSASAGMISIALFDGDEMPHCVAVLTSSVESAIAFAGALGSALETPAQ
jgi:hypothetical protein